MGQHAQYPHYTLVSHLEGIPIIPGLTSTGLFGKTSSNVIRTHPYAHPHIRRLQLQYTLYVFDNEVGAILDGHIASTSTIR
jgi:hypothetical protein